MSAINDGGPAFPSGSMSIGDGDTQAFASGMSMRAYLAGQTITAIGNWCPNRDDGCFVNWNDLGEVARLRAEFAVMQADALIAELAKGGAQ